MKWCRCALDNNVLDHLTNGLFYCEYKEKIHLKFACHEHKYNKYNYLVVMWNLIRLVFQTASCRATIPCHFNSCWDEKYSKHKWRAIITLLFVVVCKQLFAFLYVLRRFLSCNSSKNRFVRRLWGWGFFCLTLTFSILHCAEESFFSLVNSCGFVGRNWLAFLSLYFYCVVSFIGSLCIGRCLLWPLMLFLLLNSMTPPCLFDQSWSSCNAPSPSWFHSISPTTTLTRASSLFP